MLKAWKSEVWEVDENVLSFNGKLFGGTDSRLDQRRRADWLNTHDVVPLTAVKEALAAVYRPHMGQVHTSDELVEAVREYLRGGR